MTPTTESPARRRGSCSVTTAGGRIWVSASSSRATGSWPPPRAARGVDGARRRPGRLREDDLPRPVGGRRRAAVRLDQPRRALRRSGPAAGLDRGRGGRDRSARRRCLRAAAVAAPGPLERGPAPCLSRAPRVRAPVRDRARRPPQRPQPRGARPAARARRQPQRRIDPGDHVAGGARDAARPPADPTAAGRGGRPGPGDDPGRGGGPAGGGGAGAGRPGGRTAGRAHGGLARRPLPGGARAGHRGRRRARRRGLLRRRPPRRRLRPRRVPRRASGPRSSTSSPGPRCSTASSARSATRSSSRTDQPRCCDAWRARTCCSCRSTGAISSIATTPCCRRCSRPSSSAAAATWRPRCTSARAAGTPSTTTSTTRSSTRSRRGTAIERES